jgi:hypothetical protein
MAGSQRGPALTCYGCGGTEKGAPPMRGTHLKSFSSYRDAIAERIKGGEPFGDVEDAIDDAAELSTDQKAALWLFAFALRDPTEQQLDARTHLASLH